MSAVRRHRRHHGIRLLLVLALCVPAARLCAHGDLLQLIAAATADIAQHPDDAELYLDRGKLYRFDQNWPAALADLDRAAALAPRLVEVDLCRGLTLHDAGRDGEAMAALTRYLAAVPGDPEALASRALVLRALGRHAEALVDLGRAEAADPHPQPQLYLDWADTLLAVAPAAAAVAVLERGMGRLGRVVSLDQAALSAELAGGAHDAALARLARLIADAERPEGWLLQRGDLLRRLGRGDEAAADYRRGLAALDTLGPARRNAAATRATEAGLRDGLTACTLRLTGR
jgi:tetratricopeptide (TPR) repeat protein